MNIPSSHLWRALVLAAAILPGLTGCQHKDVRNAAQKMTPELDIKKQLDLGIILDTTIPLELTIPVKNAANHKITISKVSKDCACTSVTIDKMILLPGETATLRVVTNLTGKSDLYVSDIVVESDSFEKVDEIEIRGQITGQIRIRPLRTTVLMGEKYAPGNFTVFCNNENGEWEYAGFTSDEPNIGIQLTKKSFTSTTSTYAGTVNITQDTNAKEYPDYHVSLVTLKFTNDHLHKNLELKYPVEMAVHKNLEMDPPQVTFNSDRESQKRTVLIQSTDPIHIDSAVCNSSFVTAGLHWINTKALLIELVSRSNIDPHNISDNTACSLRSGGKVIASIPINRVDIP